MTNNEAESDKDIASDVLPAVVAEDAIPVNLDQLYPWHKPRKQFVREAQWIMLSRRLLGKLQGTPFLQKGPDGKLELNYLTLPGIDYLDVRELANCCADSNVELTSTGFLEGGENNPERARAQVREESLKEAGHITDRSYTFPRRLEDISSRNSRAYLDLRRRGPFHIVNIDACGSIALPLANHAQRIVDAIYRIIELQLEVCTGRWLLFVTANVTANDLSNETMLKLSSVIEKNATASDRFRDRSISLLSDSDSTLSQAINLASQKSGERFVKLFSLGFAKWIIHLAAGKSWHLKMHHSYYYSTAPQTSIDPSMPCLAFEFVPPDPGLPDPFKVTNAEPASRNIQEDPALRALSKVEEMADLDELMSSDQTLRKSKIATTKKLLQDAGYEASALKKLDDFDV